MFLFSVIGAIQMQYDDDDDGTFAACANLGSISVIIIIIIIIIILLDLLDYHIGKEYTWLLATRGSLLQH